MWIESDLGGHLIAKICFHTSTYIMIYSVTDNPNMSSRFSSNSVAYASELLENISLLLTVVSES